MKRMVAIMAGLLLMAAQRAGAVNAEWYALSVPEMAAHGGATHLAEFSWREFTLTSTNTAQVFTNTVRAKTSVECVGMLMDEAFDTANTNFTGSCALKIGDGSDDDIYLTSTELASDGTEVFVKYAPPNSATVSYTSAILTNVPFNGTTGNVTVVTGITAAGTVGELGRKVYTAAGVVTFTFTPNLNEALTANAAGRVRVYFRMMEFGR